MLLAYIDEIGEPGAFVSHDHSKYGTSAAFGYAGFIIPEDEARGFGASFQREKVTLFASESAGVEHVGRWEKKGASIFRPATPSRYPQQLRVFNSLVKKVCHIKGGLFYYADEKPIGTPKQTRLNTEERESRAMSEALNRLARYADNQGHNILVMIDQVNEKTRADRLPRMYGHIFGRASEHPEMLRIVEPPMHIDSVLSSNIQFADWVAACVGRAIDYQLVRDSRHQWITEDGLLPALRGAFTYESKLHLHKKSVNDIPHSEVFLRRRPLHPVPGGHLVAESVDPDVGRKIRGIAESSHKR